MPDEKDTVGIIWGVTVGGTTVDVGATVGVSVGIGFSVTVAIGLIGDCIVPAFDVQAITAIPSTASTPSDHFPAEVFMGLSLCVCLKSMTYPVFYTGLVAQLHLKTCQVSHCNLACP
jgi:hypothetical protein